MQIRSRYDAPLRVSIDKFDVSKTQQHFANDCDINEIMRRSMAGQLVETNERQPVFGDFGDVEDYQSSLNHVIDAQNAFDALPSNVRERFHNDPGMLLKFVSDENNRDEAVKLGLIEPPVVVEPPAPILVKMAPEEPPAQSST